MKLDVHKIIIIIIIILVDVCYLNRGGTKNRGLYYILIYDMYKGTEINNYTV